MTQSGHTRDRAKMYKAARISVFAILATSLCQLVLAADSYFDSDGINIHFVDEGDGSPVLLIHGFTWNIEGDWVGTGIYSGLVDDGYRVVALNLRGHGKSAWPQDSEQYGRHMVEDVRRLLDHLSIDRAHVVGYSMGGTMAATFGALHPERAYSLTVGGTGFPFRHQEPMTPEQAAEAFVNWDVPAELDPEAISAMSATYNALAPTEDELSRIVAPTLVIIGDRDVKDRAAALAGRITNARLSVVPGDHEGASSTPEFFSAIAEFLTENAVD